ncbi:MAG: hypothetical protein IPN90_02705 [Elusimicrobia bacterium]|nr:hypothetical protein [Elusimicrobiota bacterium]
MNEKSVLESPIKKTLFTKDVILRKDIFNEEIDQARVWWFLEQLIETHPFKKYLMPRLSVVYDICLSNRDLREALERVLRQYKNGRSRWKIRWPWWSCRREIRCLRQLLDYVYFGSDKFLATVTRP